MNTTESGHHGDIHIRHLGDVPPPADAIEVADPEAWVVAYDESSGHRHRVVGPRVRFFRAPDGMTAWALVEGHAALFHDSVEAPGVTRDHGPHGLAPGLTEFRRKREATLEGAGWAKVVD